MNGGIQKIVRSGLCSGCGLCAGITPNDKIKMGISNDGFLRPTLKKSLSLEEEEIITATCPGISLVHDHTDDVHYDPVWGPVKGTRVGFSNDAEMRRLASSGGALSGILLHLLQSDAIDFVVHIGMSPSQPFRNELFESRTREDILQRTGSRYSPSAPLMSLAKALDTPGRFAVVGKPCDIAGLRRFLRIKPDLKERIPALVSFFCAGVPSETGTLDLLGQLGAKKEDLKEFRYRGDGWPGFAKATMKDGRSYQMDYNRSWGQILNRYLQFRCKICPDGTGEFADIVCADAWYGGEDGYPDFSERDGRSIIITRTARGEAIVHEAIARGYISADALSIEELPAMQPYQKRRKQLSLSRLAALAILLKPVPSFRGLELWNVARRAGFLTNLRSFLGTMARALKLNRQSIP